MVFSVNGVDGGWALTLQILNGRWFMMFASALIMSVAGATYIFGLYSNNLKSSLGYDQTTLLLLSFFKDLGANVGILPGLINEVTPPWVVLSMGVVLNFFGFFMVWLAVTSRIARPQIWHMCLYIFVGSNSQAFANTGSLVTCVKNFPESRSVVLGLLKGFLGLSSAIITQLYHGIYGAENASALILLIAWLPPTISIVFLRTIRIIRVAPQPPNELQVFHKFLYLSLALAGFLLIVIVVQKMVHFTRLEYVSSAVIVLILLLLPITPVIKEEYSIWKSKKQAATVPAQLKISTETPTAPPTEQEVPVSCFKDVFRPPERGEDYTIFQALFSIDMLIIIFASICGIGGTLTAVDNLGQIGASLGYPSRSISTFVSLISIWNFLGRVVAGFASEILQTKYKFPRPLLLTVVLFFSCIGYILIAFNVWNGLYVATIIIGFCLGAQYPLLLTIISEIFGLKYYSSLSNFGVAACPVGSYVLNVIVTGGLYDEQAEKQMKALGLAAKGNNNNMDCKGEECFKLAFIIITAVTVAGALGSAILVLRTWKFYRSDVNKKFREEGVETEAEVVEMETTAAENGDERPARGHSKIDDC
ncbi:uncharacterized protein LOC127797004 [Diospyros lotus]|uniref:uncharacterized protein LOC127797004 n=1 Tax=Diospyros lotus TaxID=55363 RepID=UPI00225455BA|nr:uncharacterized protein LOC127797004 [Diospyros lotus]